MSSKISALSAASALDGTEVFPVVQGGATKKALISAISTYIASLGRAFAKALGVWWMLGASGVQTAAHTGDTNEAILATITIPADAVGPNGLVRVRAVYYCTGSTNNKTLRTRLGGISGDPMHSQIIASSFQTFATMFTIQNRNSASSQVGAPTSNSGIGGIAAAVLTGTKDTTGALDLVITGQLASAGESIGLESYMVEVLYKA